MKILAEVDKKIFILPGDTINLLYMSGDGVVTKVINHEITKTMELDTGVVFECEDGELGFECGIGGAFGKRKV